MGVWYKEANALYKEIKENEPEADKPSKDREAIIKELEKEMKQLEGAANLSHTEFLNYVFEEFPPLHKENRKKPQTNGSSREPMQKAFVKLSWYYHPDSVDESIHGEKYKVLCGEITKVINSRICDMKNN